VLEIQFGLKNLVEKFRYLGSIMHEDRGIEEDIEGRIKCGWMK